MTNPINQRRCIELLSAFVAGELQAQQFDVQFSQFWRDCRDHDRSDAGSSFNSLMDSVFTACDSFDPNPLTRELSEYDAEGLRDFVVGVRDELLKRREI